MEYVEVARAESERGEIVLRTRVDPVDPHGAFSPVLELRVNGVFVMDTQETTTERQLAAVALARTDAPRTVVIGGLGFGFTLHEVLSDHRVERVAVVEVEDALVRWMRDGTVPHGPALLADERLEVIVADITMAMAEATPAAYDLVLLDVDNGPGYLVYEQNASIYQRAFLSQVHGTLRPGGTVVLWSSADSPELTQTLEDVFGAVEAISHDVVLSEGDDETPARTALYWLYLARR